MSKIGELHAEIESHLNTNKELAKTLALKALEAAKTNQDINAIATSLKYLVKVNEQFGNYNEDGLHYLDQFIEFSQENALTNFHLQGLNFKITHLLSTDLEKASKLCEEATLVLIESGGDLQVEQLNLSYNQIQIYTRKQSQLDEGLQLAFESLQVAQSLKNYDLQCLFLQSISILNSMMGNMKQSIEYMEELITLAVQYKDYNNICGASGYIAYVYYKSNNLEKALEKFEQAEQAAQAVNNIHAYVNVALRKIRMLLELGNTEKAHEAILLLEPSVKESKHARSQNLLNFFKADYYAQLQLPEDAIKILESLLADELYMSDKIEKMYVLQKLHLQYKLIGDYKNAYEYFEQFYAIRTDILEDERAQKVAELQAKFDSERKDALLKQMHIDQLNSELRLLKSQMNPHFIFNAMGSIANLIQYGKNNEAQDSIQKFSTLMRSSLEQSQGDEIVLEDEISFLKSYLHLEQLVLGDSFTYSFSIDEEIDEAYDRIPSMILQPIVENAIKHGLRTKEGEKTLSIQMLKEIHLENEVLKIIIKDNGIGRAASAELNKHRKNHHSFASKSIIERIQIINTSVEREKITLEMLDLVEGEHALGTEVVLTILY